MGDGKTFETTAGSDGEEKPMIDLWTSHPLEPWFVVILRQLYG